MRSLPYEIVDVFTDRPFTGNPLAVVFDGDDLAGSQMQALAQEFHLSETIFVLAPSEGVEATYAGHPSVGAAVTVARRRGLSVDGVVQECGAGLLPIRLLDGGRARLTGGVATVGEALDPAPLLQVAGLTMDDFAGTAPRVAGCGLEFPFLSVRKDAVARAAGDPGAARQHKVTDVCVFHWDPVSHTAHTRVFVPGLGVPEDPATGSAALGFGVWLVTSGLLPADGESTYTVRQGIEMHRPSTLECTVTAQRGQVLRATVTGAVVPIASGTIIEPPFVG
jgi:trans-2,3-dihydro-3-hydroxyanthranilate isomerase